MDYRRIRVEYQVGGKTKRTMVEADDVRAIMESVSNDDHGLPTVPKIGSEPTYKQLVQAAVVRRIRAVRAEEHRVAERERIERQRALAGEKQAEAADRVEEDRAVEQATVRKKSKAANAKQIMDELMADGGADAAKIAWDNLVTIVRTGMANGERVSADLFVKANTEVLTRLAGRVPTASTSVQDHSAVHGIFDRGSAKRLQEIAEKAKAGDT